MARAHGLPSNYFMTSQVRKRKAIEKARLARIAAVQEELRLMDLELDRKDVEEIKLKMEKEFPEDIDGEEAGH